jgi:hypothetical protein
MVHQRLDKTLAHSARGAQYTHANSIWHNPSKVQ